jgi:hypothetical protein
LQPATGSERTGEKHLKQQQDMNESLEERTCNSNRYQSSKQAGMQEVMREEDA